MRPAESPIVSLYCEHDKKTSSELMYVVITLEVLIFFL